MDTLCLICEGSFQPPLGSPHSKACLACRKHLRRRLSRYNVSPDEYLNALAGQDRKCAICNEQVELFVDKKERVLRGLLCQRCLSGVGVFKDRKLLRAAASYLQAHPLEPQYPSCIRCLGLSNTELCGECRVDLRSKGLDENIVIEALKCSPRSTGMCVTELSDLKSSGK
jgi:hypothetical protein